MQYTTTLRLRKPDYTDVADISVLNLNMDDVDTALAKMVTTDGNQEITGLKTFNHSGDVLVLKHPTLNASAHNQGSVYQEVTFHDSGNREIGNIINWTTDGNTRLILETKNLVSGATAQTGIVVRDDGVAYVPIPEINRFTPSNGAVNKGYVESTDGTTNNLVHRSANESISGIKTFNDYAVGKFHGRHIFVTPNINDNIHWFKVAEWEATNTVFVFEIYGSLNNVSLSYAKIMAGHLSNTNTLCSIENKGTNTGVKLQAKMTIVGAKCTLWVRSRAYHRAIINHIGSFGYGEWQTLNITGTDDTTLYDEPTTPSGGSLVNMLEMV